MDHVLALSSLDDYLHVVGSSRQNIANGVHENGAYESGIRNEAIHAALSLGDIVEQVAIQVVSEAEGMDWALGAEVLDGYELTIWWMAIWDTISEQHDVWIPYAVSSVVHHLNCFLNSGEDIGGTTCPHTIDDVDSRSL